MSTTKQMSLMEMINRLSAGIEDDELFCQEEFEMVRNYCEQKSFMMSAADLSTSIPRCSSAGSRICGCRT